LHVNWGRSQLIALVLLESKGADAGALLGGGVRSQTVKFWSQGVVVFGKDD